MREILNITAQFYRAEQDHSKSREEQRLVLQLEHLYPACTAKGCTVGRSFGGMNEDAQKSQMMMMMQIVNLVKKEFWVLLKLWRTDLVRKYQMEYGN